MYKPNITGVFPQNRFQPHDFDGKFSDWTVPGGNGHRSLAACIRDHCVGSLAS